MSGRGRGDPHRPKSLRQPSSPDPNYALILNLNADRYPVCPPPESVGGSIGESRTVRWSPAGLYWGEEIDVDALMADVPADLPEGVDPKDYARDALSSHVNKMVDENYKVLEKELSEYL